nr:CoA transferase [Gordonia oryzae]
MTPSQPLAGIRVLELGNYIAAPTAGRMLADFGAEVIKVERPDTGDELRGWRLYAGETSMLFRTINRNKRSVEIDLRTEAGQRTIQRLIPHCDVLLENFRPGTLDRWGLDAKTLDALNPRLVIARISAFGQTGPMSGQPGFAAVAEAMGGMRALIGEPDRPPARTGVSIGDTIAGLYAAFGTIMALYERETSPSPPPIARRTIDVALNESVLSVMESLIPDFSAYGVRRERVGGRIEGIAPSNAYPCADGRDVVIAGNSDAIFQRLMAVIARADLAADTELATNAGRWRRRDELDVAIGEWTAQHSRDFVLEKLNADSIPAGAIYTAEDLCDDEQLRSRNMIQKHRVDIAGHIEDVYFPGIVPVIGERSGPIRSLGPDLGEGTREILERFADTLPGEAHV